MAKWFIDHAKVQNQLKELVAEGEASFMHRINQFKWFGHKTALSLDVLPSIIRLAFNLVSFIGGAITQPAQVWLTNWHWFQLACLPASAYTSGSVCSSIDSVINAYLRVK